MLNERTQLPIRVLFLCTGNSARSQIAEALLTRKGSGRFIAASAGTSPAAAVHPEAVAALQARGIDWGEAKPKSVEQAMNETWDIVITVCDRARESCPNLPNRPVTAHWGVPDPVEVRDARARTRAFDDTLSLLSWRIDLMLALRTDLLDRLVIEERLNAIATQAPPAQSDHDTGAP